MILFKRCCEYRSRNDVRCSKIAMLKYSDSDEINVSIRDIINPYKFVELVRSNRGYFIYINHEIKVLAKAFDITFSRNEGEEWGFGIKKALEVLDYNVKQIEKLVDVLEKFLEDRRKAFVNGTIDIFSPYDWRINERVFESIKALNEGVPYLSFSEIDIQVEDESDREYSLINVRVLSNYQMLKEYFRSIVKDASWLDYDLMTLTEAYKKAKDDYAMNPTGEFEKIYLDAQEKLNVAKLIQKESAEIGSTVAAMLYVYLDSFCIKEKALETFLTKCAAGQWTTLDVKTDENNSK